MTEKENFIKWLEDNNKLEIRFNEISDTLEKYLEDYLKVRELDVSKRLEDVLSKCNEIDYEDKEVVMAYIVMYFLDRLRRFQLNYKKLFEKGLLPIKEKISIISRVRKRDTRKEQDKRNKNKLRRIFKWI